MVAESRYELGYDLQRFICRLQKVVLGLKMYCTSCTWIIIQMVTTVYLYRPLESTDPLDITFFSSPHSSYVRGWVLRNSKTTDLSIGILYKNDKDNVTWADTGYSGDIFGSIRTRAMTKDMPDNRIFDTRSKIAYRILETLMYLGVQNLQESERVGVFSFEGTKSAVKTRSGIVVTSSSASIIMQFRTLTVGIGESVTINLRKGGDYSDLRWRHNYGDEIQMWNGESSITIGNIRAKDDGVYECYRSGSLDNNRGVMRLIVRDCPLPKWSPPECEKDCPVCYNGGLCDDKTGICICPTGFAGNNCQISCGSNNFGRNCDVVCSSGKPEGCKGYLFCPPDPFGCTCIDGYGGNNCSIECAAGYYGADCRQVCHCNSDDCNRKEGCRSGSTCSYGYMGAACRDLMPDQACPSGNFGVLCNYPCHCKDSADCNRDGSCDNGCHVAWAWKDCSIALPYSSKPPKILNETATTLKIACSWDPVQDFGTGPITVCKLWYRISRASEFTIVDNIENGVYTIESLLPHTTVEFYTQLSRFVGDQETDGPPGEHGSAETICKKPLEVPEIELETVDGNEIILILKPVSNAPEQIQCDDILRYQVRYQSKDGNEHGIVNTTDGLQKKVRILKLSPGCVSYQVDSRVVNNEEIVGDWGETIAVQTAPSVPSIVSKISTILETSFTMKWYALASCNNGTDLLYHYCFNYVDSNDEYTSGNTTDTEVEITISDDVEPCTEFIFKVSVSFMGVIGPASSIKLLTDAELPGVPEMLSAEYSGGSINVEWRPPVNIYCPVSYTVILESGDEQIFSKVTDDTRVTFTVEDGISSDKNYIVKLAAMTAKGTGSYLGTKVVNIDKICSDVSSSQSAIIVLVILFVISVSVISALLWKLRKFKQQNRGESVKQQRDEDAFYINQFPKVDQTSLKNKTEDAYMDLEPTEQGRGQAIYTDLEKTYEVVDTKQ